MREKRAIYRNLRTNGRDSKQETKSPAGESRASKSPAVGGGMRAQKNRDR